MSTDTTKSDYTPGNKNADPITGAPGSHPGGTAIGTASGAATGAAIGSLGGPIGTVIGAVAGGIVGAGVGHTAGEAHDPTDPKFWRDQYKNSSYYDENADFDRDVAPAYEYGTTLPTATATSSGGKSTFEAVEDKAREGWEKVKGSSTHSYDKARGAIRDAYETKTNASNTGNYKGT